MKHFFTVLLLTFLFIRASAAQDSVKTNPIIYGDLGFGTSGTKTNGGVQLNTSLNYQYRQSLFTMRLAAVQFFDTETVSLSPFTFFPVFRDDGNLTEWSLLYGRRLVMGGVSFSISAGASYNNITLIDYQNDKKHQMQQRYPGFPFELNILFFKARKRRYHVYYVIPVGRPTGFGHSIGLKLLGNVSKYSYFSAGLVFGLGYHKQY